jgi:flagellin
MSRINTNVTSLVAQNILGRSNKSLEQALNRLSTGLRINTGKDDPAGLIASENLRSDISSIQRAISNTDRANQVIATADSALGQVSSLLNDIRGLVTESANSGALSDDQIAANQLQIDQSLEAINRIAQTTKFQGRTLLNGSLDFTISAGANYSNITNLRVDQANLGATGTLAVATEVTTAATQASVEVTGIDLSTDAAQGVNEADITATQVEAEGTLVLAGETIDLVALAGGDAEGAEGNQVDTLAITFGAGAAAADYDETTDTLSVSVTQAADTADIDNIIAAIMLSDDFDATLAAGSDGDTTVGVGDDAAAVFDVSGGQDASTDTITITTEQDTNDYNATGLSFIQDTTLTANTAVASYNSETDEIEVRINGTRTYAQIATAIAALDEFTAVATTGTGVVSGDALGLDDTSITAAVTNTTEGNPGGLSEDVVFELSGSTGAEVFNFQAGTTLDSVVDAINLFTDATGVTAEGAATTLTLSSSAYGSNAFVDVKVLTEDSTGDFTTAIGQGTRGTGTDAVARINGLLATADGNKLSVNTASLDVSIELEAAFTGTINFDITGGGALFQLGPDVVSNQQVRIGINSLNTARLGGSSGKLYQLQSGGDAALSEDPTSAASIVEEAINQVTTLRGRLGAFQRTLLETNKNALSDTLVNLTDAESAIRDADFAAETAALTRAQILVQSGTTVLSIANQIPQNVLALLR